MNDRDMTGQQVVIVVNVHGVVEAFGPYDDDEAHEVASFACRLVPTWRVTLAENEMGDRGHVCR